MQTFDAAPGWAIDSDLKDALRFSYTAIGGARQQTLADRAYQALEYLYVTGGIGPGALVSEPQLAREIGLGRTPMREAIKRMEADHLLVPIHRRGFLVRDVGLREYVYMLEVREPIETALFRATATRADDTRRGEIAQYAEMFRRSRETADRLLTVKADYLYKQASIEAAANPFFGRVLRPLHAIGRRFWNIHASFEQRATDMNQATHRHVAIIEAIVAGDPGATDRCVREFFVFLRDFAARLSEEQIRI